MQNPLTSFSACRQEKCCREEFELYIVLPPESSLGKYRSKKYDPAPGAWPFDFRCADCQKQSRYHEKDITEVRVVERGDPPFFYQAYLEGKGLWHVEINYGPYSDSKPQSIYTIAGSTLNWERFVEQGTLVSKCWYSYKFLP